MSIQRVVQGSVCGAWLCACSCHSTQYATPNLGGSGNIALVEEGRFTCISELKIDDPVGKRATMYYMPSGPVRKMDWGRSPFAGLRKRASEDMSDPIAQQLQYMLMILDKHQSVVAICFVYKSGGVRINRVGERDGAGRIIVGSLGKDEWFEPVGRRGRSKRDWDA